LNKYKKTDAFLVYCALEPRSVFATARLKELGFTNVKYLQKGFKNWSKKGLPIKK
jgi:rhodanese-related sulfurtransferase